MLRKGETLVTKLNPMRSGRLRSLTKLKPPRPKQRPRRSGAYAGLGQGAVTLPWSDLRRSLTDPFSPV